MKPEILYETYRGKILEKQHFGFVLAVDKNENIFYKTGDDENNKFWFRSAAKPMQASLIIQSGAYKKFNMTLQELAVCCASHSGTAEHVECVESILNKIGLSENHLLCGVAEPLDKSSRDTILIAGKNFSTLHNNCSGKHAGMLAVCVANNWDIKTYTDYSHELQKIIKTSIADFCNYPESEIDFEKDGCGSPVHSMPHYKMGIGYINLFNDKNYVNIKQAIKQYPVLAGGNSRLDTEIIRATKGKLISKVAAEGLCITLNTLTEQALVVKILDANPKARFNVTIESLNKLNWISQEQHKNLLLISNAGDKI